MQSDKINPIELSNRLRSLRRNAEEGQTSAEMARKTLRWTDGKDEGKF